MPDFPHQHIALPPTRRELQFKGSGRGKFNRRTNLNREQHAARLQRQITSIDEAFSGEQERRELDALEGEDFGLLLNVKSAPGYPLKLDSIEKAPTKNHDGIYLLNVRYRQTAQGVITEAAILVPFGQLKALGSKVTAYADSSKDSTNKEGVSSPRNADLLANIDDIGVAALEALWTESEPLPESEAPLWWELWVSRAPRADTATASWPELFERTREALGLEVNRFRLRLPDNEIVLVKATRSQLESSLDLLNTLTEVKKVRPCSIDLSDLPGPEQHEWIDEALGRVTLPGINAPAVCLLDTGVNREHPLLANLLAEEDLDTVIPAFGSADHADPRDAHGTPMAGIAAYDDLRKLMLASGPWVQKHRLESVKIIHEGNEHHPDNYGAVTQEAIARPESRKPLRPRVYCLAITQAGFPAEGQPSSWSAAIDSAAAGGNGSFQKRLVFVSAGNQRNFLSYRYPTSNHQSPVENPAQAWNVVTVGAMTRRCTITEADDESQRARAVVTQEARLSPFSRTTRSWDPHWPIKPEIVMEGGNLAQTESGALIERNSLEPISTASNFRLGRPLCNMNATSSATASASRLGAMLHERIPGFWPETYRGLMVHSARWRPSMLGNLDPHAAGNAGRVQNLLRDYGFGEPDEPRLFGSGESGVTMIIQDSIQPYDPESTAGAARLHHFHLHQLPWPQQVFDRHRDVQLTLRVTLSYFIEPSPGSRCWHRSKKYRYASHLLRFSFKRSTESEAVFRRALEKRIEEEDEDEEIEVGTGDERRAPSDSKWALGPKLCGKSGSLVQDVWKGSPAELAEMGHVAVYPAKGWFATRSFRPGHEFYESHKSPVRYSLIVSIDAEQEIGLYTAISNMLSVSIG
jgi:hypothetical protein